jgi:hypothetical protein
VLPIYVWIESRLEAPEAAKMRASDSGRVVGIGLEQASAGRPNDAGGRDSGVARPKNRKKQAQFPHFFMIRSCPSGIVTSQYWASAIREGSSMVTGKPMEGSYGEKCNEGSGESRSEEAGSARESGCTGEEGGSEAGSEGTGEEAGREGSCGQEAGSEGGTGEEAGCEEACREEVVTLLRAHAQLGNWR